MSVYPVGGGSQPAREPGPQPHHAATFTVTTSGPGGTVSQHSDLGDAIHFARDYLQRLANPGPHTAPTMGSATVAIVHQGAINY